MNTEKSPKTGRTVGRPREKYERIIWLIRLLLIGSMVVNIVSIVVQITDGGNLTREELTVVLSTSFEQLFYAALALLLSFVSDYIERRSGINIPDALELVVALFIFAAIYLSSRFDLYHRYFWWDDLLHTLSGVIIGFIGFLAIYKINHKFSMDISPTLVALFSFTFAVTIGVIWEIYEFAMDVYFMTDMQKWSMPETTVLMGKSYQGAGLRDTMSDLIVDSVGALITSVICYFLYKNDKRKALEMMHGVFPERKPAP